MFVYPHTAPFVAMTDCPSVCVSICTYSVVYSSDINAHMFTLSIPLYMFVFAHIASSLPVLNSNLMKLDINI